MTWFPGSKSTVILKRQVFCILYTHPMDIGFQSLMRRLPDTVADQKVLVEFARIDSWMIRTRSYVIWFCTTKIVVSPVSTGKRTLSTL